MPEWFWYITGPIAITLYVSYYFWSRRNSSSILAAEASSRGWRYDANDRAYASHYSGWPFDRRGRKARHVITGAYRGREFVSYEFSFRMSMGYRYADDGLLRNRCRYQVVSMAHGNDAVPDLTLSRTDAISRISDALFDEGTEIGSEEFRHKFSVSTRDTDSAALVLAGPMSEWLASDTRASNGPLKFEKGAAVTWRSGAINIPSAVESLDYLSDVIDRIPPRSKGHARNL